MKKKLKLDAIPTKKSLHSFSKTKAITAMVIFAFGISMISSVIILDNVIQIKIDEAIAEQITVPNPRDSDYDEWVSDNNNKDAIPFYSKYNMWNLTNPAEYLTGNKPIYEEIGPYVFREYTTKYNVKYSSNKEEVSYNSYSTYKFDKGRSGKLSLNDSITNINPGYLGVLNLTKTESGLIGMMSPTVFSTVKTTFETVYLEQLNLARPSFYNQIFAKIKEIASHYILGIYDEDIGITSNDILNRIMNYITQPGFPERVFYEEWANGRFPDVPDSIFSGVTLKVYILFVWWLEDIGDDLANEHTGDLVESEAHKEIVKNADIDGREPYNCPGTPNDLTALYSSPIIPEVIIRKIWDSNDIFSLVGEDPSYWWKAVDGDTNARQFLINHFTFEIEILGFHIIIALNNAQLDKILAWLRQARDGNANYKGWLANVCNYEIEHMNSGLLTTRTVEEWLFDAEDNLIKNVYPELAKVNIFDNCQNNTEALEEGTDRFTIKTGKNNVDEAKETVKYNGEEEITMWARDIDVKGTDGTQFSPGLTMDDDTLKAFVSLLARPVDFEFSELTELYDIKLYRYKFSEELFEPAPDYYMDTNGLANMYPKYGIPAYLSKPHFLGADPSVSRAVSGMNPDAEKHDAYIDVEPITGITMNARARLQLNLKATPTDKWYTDVQEAYMPILWVEKEGEIPEEKAEEFKESLYEALELRRTLIPAIAGLGALMTVIGAMFSYTETVKRRTARVQRIKEKYGGNKLIKQPPISK